MPSELRSRSRLSSAAAGVALEASNAMTAAVPASLVIPRVATAQTTVVMVKRSEVALPQDCCRRDPEVGTERHSPLLRLTNW